MNEIGVSANLQINEDTSRRYLWRRIVCAFKGHYFEENHYTLGGTIDTEIQCPRCRLTVALVSTIGVMQPTEE